jgi:DNA polymerase-3 subunit gamma/tau
VSDEANNASATAGNGAGSDGPGLDLGLPAAAPRSDAKPGYRVLARKYRPQTFDDLIGQDAMVRTLANAFAAGRIPQAWILTGVRGVGKTTTARILARALNYEVPGKVSAPTVEMPELGLHCQAIIDSRHVDVIEMDAASHTSINDIREIIDSARYRPVSARIKVYIIDEVHMLSTQAFNGLLKTLEEPPEHVKFVFATTEIRKVPVTVLSRCQRFDLRRIEAGMLVAHLARICKAEAVEAEQEALALIARAAEGSVRDALSLTDQAIAHGGGRIEADSVRAMLGLADRARVIDLFEALMRGDMATALKDLREQYDAGADPAVILADLAEFTHLVTRVKLVPAVADDPALTQSERERSRSLAANLSMRILGRAWQMLLKAIPEAQAAPRPVAAAEMALVRIAYAADLPSPDEAIRALSSGAPMAGAPGGLPGGGNGPRAEARAQLASGSAASAPRLSPTPAHGPAPGLAAAPERPAMVLKRFEDIVALALSKQDLMLKTALERDVRLVSFADGNLTIGLEPAASRALPGDLMKKLSEWTGRRWMVSVSSDSGQATLKAQEAAKKADVEQGVRGDARVQAVLAAFPGAEIVAVHVKTPETTLPTGDPDSDTAFAEDMPPDARFGPLAPDDDFQPVE